MHSDYRSGIESNPLSYATNFASELGCEEWEDDEAKEILACLQSIPYRKLSVNLIHFHDFKLGLAPPEFESL